MLLSINIGEAKNFSKIPSMGFIGLISPCKRKGTALNFLHGKPEFCNSSSVWKLWP